MPPEASRPAAPAVCCPDDDLLSRFAGGGLGAVDHEEVERHVASCDDCRRLVAGLARAGVVPVADARPARLRVLGLPWQAAAIAAAVLLAIGAYAMRPAPTGPHLDDTDTRLVAAATDLAARRPDLFLGFRPLDAAERKAGSSDVRRGGLSPLVPAGTTLSTRPDFRWSAVAGATSYSLKVVDADGTTVFETKTTEPFVLGSSLTKDLLRGGDFVWKVKAIGAQPPSEGTKAFSVARDDAAKSFEAARAAIAALGPDVPQDLLLAHFAWRRGHLAEALAAARRHAAAHPDDRAGQETLDRIVADLGPGATALR